MNGRVMANLVCKAVIAMPLLMSASLPASQSPAQGELGTGSAISLSAESRSQIVVAFADAMRDRYIYPAVGAQVSHTLRSKLAAGQYDALANAASLARQLSADAASIVNDKHLRVWTRRAESRRNAAATHAPDPSGITRADRLVGGWGYIEVVGFPELTTFKPAANAAMSALSGSRGLIVDLRRNLGGEPASVAYLISFLIAQNQPVNTVVSRVAGTNTFRRETFTSVVTPVTFASAPVYVLTSAQTFSAGEEFAYDVQALRRGQLIGEVTAGGANPTELVQLGYSVMATIPSERAENTITKTNWEGQGVRPSVVVPASEAFRVAMQLAGQKFSPALSSASVGQVFGSPINADAANRR